MPDSFELGPIRPPSEAYSLLIRVTKNCSWNRCKFCHIYKGQRFELRTVEEVKQDILAAREIRDRIKAMAWKSGYGDNLEAVGLDYVLVTKWNRDEWPEQYEVLAQSGPAQKVYDDGYSVIWELH